LDPPELPVLEPERAVRAAAGGALAMVSSSRRRSSRTLRKGRERGATAKMKTKGAEALIEPTDDVEDERLLGDRLAEVPKIFRHAFEAAAVVDDG